MAITGLNHITIAVDDLTAAVDFYESTLGMVVKHQWPTGAYLSIGGLWLCLAVDAQCQPSADYSHVAFDIAAEDFLNQVEKIVETGVEIWKDNRSEGDSLYFRDPSGNKLELHVGTLADRLRFIENDSASRTNEGSVLARRSPSTCDEAASC